MPIGTEVQFKAATASATGSVAVTLAAAPTAGNWLVAAFKDNDGTSTITLPSGWAWAPNAPWKPITGRQIGIAYKKAGVGESATVTFSSTATAANKELVVVEIPGITNLGMVGVGTNNTSAVTSLTLTSSGTLPAANCWVMAMADQSANNGGEVSVDSGFSLRGEATMLLQMVATKTTSVTTALSPTFVWTTSRASMGFIAVFPEYIPGYSNANVFDGTTWNNHSLHVIV